MATTIDQDNIIETHVQELKPVFGCIIAGINIAAESLNESPELILKLVKRHFQNKAIK